LVALCARPQAPSSYRIPPTLCLAAACHCPNAVAGSGPCWRVFPQRRLFAGNLLLLPMSVMFSTTAQISVLNSWMPRLRGIRRVSSSTSVAPGVEPLASGVTHLLIVAPCASAHTRHQLRHVAVPPCVSVVGRLPALSLLADGSTVVFPRARPHARALLVVGSLYVAPFLPGLADAEFAQVASLSVLAVSLLSFFSSPVIYAHTSSPPLAIMLGRRLALCHCVDVCTGLRCPVLAASFSFSLAVRPCSSFDLAVGCLLLSLCKLSGCLMLL